MSVLAADRADSPRKRILLVHAVGAHRNLRLSVMRDRGFDVVCAADCAEARLLWHPGSYDLVLFDGKHDAAANEELCRELKGANPQGKTAFLVGKPEFLSSRPAANANSAVDHSSQEYQHAFRALITEASELLPHRHGFMEAVWRMHLLRSVTPAATRDPEIPSYEAPAPVETAAPAAVESPRSFGDAIRRFELEAEANEDTADA